MRPRLLITRPVLQEAINATGEFCDVRVHPVDEPMPIEMLTSAIREVEAVMPCGVRISRELVDGARNLRVISNIGAGYDNIDIEACTERKILVTNTPDVLSEATADIAFALLLAVARRIPEGDRYIRENRWPHWQWNLLWGADLAGNTLGLYGFGRIGQAMARRGRGFSMRILYHSRHRVARGVEKELGAELVDWQTLLRQSDFLSVHVPLTADTHHSIGPAELAQMKSTAIVINTARGSVLDEDALVDAIVSRRLRGAGLDVFEDEPRIHPGLRPLTNVVLLPHIGSATEATRRRMALLAVSNVLTALNGRRPPNLLNPEVLRTESKKRGGPRALS